MIIYPFIDDLFISLDHFKTAIRSRTLTVENPNQKRQGQLWSRAECAKILANADSVAKPLEGTDRQCDVDACRPTTERPESAALFGCCERNACAPICHVFCANYKVVGADNR
ncbi:hypothetical protein GWI33_020791 [Rhynchophorus ferrugineus]|uniref:Uncharacterized protein n=1 Tax=Rhynchophorus ferrugineus TaxID=354439 RepID=A0A834M037_RHYFE|nr:hypothetical protein GWI33_020791 [Rhynchophorus ferrugineus]